MIIQEKKNESVIRNDEISARMNFSFSWRSVHLQNVCVDFFFFVTQISHWEGTLLFQHSELGWTALQFHCMHSSIWTCPNIDTCFVVRYFAISSNKKRSDKFCSYILWMDAVLCKYLWKEKFLLENVTRTYFSIKFSFDQYRALHVVKHLTMT